jgi:hypothetical protein
LFVMTTSSFDIGTSPPTTTSSLALECRSKRHFPN